MKFFIVIALLFVMTPAHAQQSICLGVNCPANSSMSDIDDPFANSARDMYSQMWGNGNFSSLNEDRKACYALCNDSYHSKINDCKEASILAAKLHYGECDDDDEACKRFIATVIAETDELCFKNARNSTMRCLGITGFANCDEEFPN